MPPKGSNFTCLVAVYGKLVLKNTDLVDLSVFPNLLRVDDTIRIESNDFLTYTNGFPALVSAKDISILNNRILRTVSGFGALTTVSGSISIQGNTRLAAIDAFSALTSVSGTFEMLSNPALSSLSTMSALTSVGMLIIQNNNFVTVDSLITLTNITQSLIVKDNPILTTLALPVGRIGAVQIQNNPVFNRLHVCRLTVVMGTVSLVGNALSCTYDNFFSGVAMGLGYSHNGCTTSGPPMNCTCAAPLPGATFCNGVNAGSGCWKFCGGSTFAISFCQGFFMPPALVCPSPSPSPMPTPSVSPSATLAASVTMSNYIRSARADVVMSITPGAPTPGGSIEVILPPGFAFSPQTTVTGGVGSLSGLYPPTRLTIQTGSLPVGSPQVYTITNVTNPDVVGPTGYFQVATRTNGANNNPCESNPYVLGVLIRPALPDFSFSCSSSEDQSGHSNITVVTADPVFATPGTRVFVAGVQAAYSSAVVGSTAVISFLADLFQPVTIALPLPWTQSLNVSYCTLPTTVSECSEPGWLRIAQTGECIPCPEGGVCPGGDIVHPLPGYWNADEHTVPVVCPVAEACLGFDARAAGGAWGESLCNKDMGYSGYRCSVCMSGFYQLDSRCLACKGGNADKADFYILVVAALCMFALLAACIIVLPTQRLDNAVALIIVMQQLILLVKMAATRLNAPPSTVHTLSILSLVALEVDLFKPGCVVPRLGFAALFWGTLLIVLAAVGMFLVAASLRAAGLLCIFWKRPPQAPQQPQAADPDATAVTEKQAATIIHARFSGPNAPVRCRKLREWFAYFNMRSTRGLLILCSMAYLTMSLRVMQALHCVPENPYSEVERLLFDPSVICYAGDHRVVAAAAWALVVVFVFGFPVAAGAVVLWGRYTNRLRNMVFERQFGYLYRGLIDRFYWLRLTTFVVSFAFAAGMALSNDLKIRTFASTVVLLLNVGLVGFIWPYKTWWTNWIQVFSGVANGTAAIVYLVQAGADTSSYFLAFLTLLTLILVCAVVVQRIRSARHRAHDYKERTGFSASLSMVLRWLMGVYVPDKPQHEESGAMRPPSIWQSMGSVPIPLDSNAREWETLHRSFDRLPKQWEALQRSFDNVPAMHHPTDKLENPGPAPRSQRSSNLDSDDDRYDYPPPPSYVQPYPAILIAVPTEGLVPTVSVSLVPDQSAPATKSVKKSTKKGGKRGFKKGGRRFFGRLVGKKNTTKRALATGPASELAASQAAITIGVGALFPSTAMAATLVEVEQPKPAPRKNGNKKTNLGAKSAPSAPTEFI